MARHKWVFVDNINRLTKKEWVKYVQQSYDLIYSKLPAKNQEANQARQKNLVKLLKKL